MWRLLSLGACGGPKMEAPFELGNKFCAAGLADPKSWPSPLVELFAGARKAGEVK